MRIVSALVLALVLAAVPAHLADESFPTEDDLVATMGPDEIIRNLAPAAGPTSGSEAERELRSVDLDIRFALNSAELLPEARRQLEALGSALTSEELKASRFLIAGHTDASGAADYNLQLSAARAEAVAEYLTTVYGLDRGRLETVGYGEDRLKNLAAPEADENRRVEVTSMRESVWSDEAEKAPQRN